MSIVQSHNASQKSTTYSSTSVKKAVLVNRDTALKTTTKSQASTYTFVGIAG